ncbi:Hypothetical protein R9X50_00185100 [Acrodontium crateriforme]|uniref:DUF7703 domain-containing protein n=1 Tax=Acrodontium crateriforme TaxID=150365 RepID=A0AAQ3M191_9PEZI|nr:Hypothetical protein R9X50_00185100 [Acrodontium crateriforme]
MSGDGNIPVSSNTSSFASWASPGAGITGGYDGDSQTLRIFIVFFAALAIYNAIELITMVFLTFHRYRGLYFWSLLGAAIGIIPYALGFLLKFMNFTTGNLRWLAVFLLTIGWYPMITGQSLVLWSRLHLIVSGERGERIIRYTKWMIIIDAIILHIPTTVLTFGANGDQDTLVFERGYNVMEKIQMIGFFLQEVTLSSIYIVETVKILRVSMQPGTRRTMKQLIIINVVIIVADLGLLGLEGASLYILETLLKGVIYSIKLKLEFAILGKLVKFVGAPKAISSPFPSEKESPDTNMNNVHDFVDLSRVRSDMTHAESVPSKRRHSNRSPQSDLDYDIARFQHFEDIETLNEDIVSQSSRSRETFEHE